MFSLQRNTASFGLDIDGRYLAAAEVQGNRLTRAVSCELSDGLLREGEVVDPEALADQIKRFVSDSHLPRNVCLGVANQQIVVRVIDLPRIDDANDRHAAVGFQAAEAIAMPLDEAVLDHRIAGYRPAADGSPRMQVVVVAARRTMVDTLMKAAKAAGLRPEGIDLDAFALVRTLGYDGHDEDETARVFCHLGGVTNLAIARGSICSFARPLSASWDEPDAGAMLADEIRLSIDYYMTQPDAMPVGEVVVSGLGSGNERLVEDLGLHLGLPITVASPLGQLDVSAAEMADDPRRYTVAAGLALGAAA